MTIDIHAAIGGTWATLGLVWAVGFPFTRKTVRSQPSGARVFHLALALLGFSLLGSTWFRAGWLGQRFMTDSRELALAGVLMTMIGCAFAIWARITLGANWSGRATVKAGHELITSGPYAVARHPIYTGLLTACVGSMIASGEWRCVLGLVMVTLALAIKIGQEERLMLETFPQAYAAYRQRVKALIPGVL
ncbi:methyltransferase family protein [Occallatibacter riparius]|uniref:Isoprenylcysteine carboxylmethyltransferase family protein n=1 Tax=Occallatibacter riparius TaxID=1002689 RepID=A0A9J7BT30_9BACT|nr:isoprenylcysteine carboxylmethyltransferase family protein [Occallatibacter riparius]UWZ84173.1 isoprenylcysteine carboxylmethyltransferase family protein [Occallatibacter riparius]